MVGPNGAGKTTTIRMLLHIIQPDQGAVLLFWRPFSREHGTLFGYLPEERSLYRDLRAQETLHYLGTFKGMRRSYARRRAEEVLERLDMSEHRGKKIAELSRGMGQLVKFAATIAPSSEINSVTESGSTPVFIRGNSSTIISVAGTIMPKLTPSTVSDPGSPLCILGLISRSPTRSFTHVRRRLPRQGPKSLSLITQWPVQETPTAWRNSSAVNTLWRANTFSVRTRCTSGSRSSQASLTTTTL